MSPLTVQYKEANQSKITTDIYLPPNASSANSPVLINIHGGAFMLGHSGMVSKPQIDDCLSRNWIVVVPNHRLCPGVNILDGPMTDCRDLLDWIYNGSLDTYLQTQKRPHRVDMDRVMAFGTSSGGMLALSLGYDVPRPPRAILNFYGAVHFTHPSWTTPLPHIQSKLPPLAPGFIQAVYKEYPIPTNSSISLEGQDQNEEATAGANSAAPNFARPRDAFAFTQLANGTVLEACFPGERDVREIDPVERIGEGFPPTFIVHGGADRMVSIEVSWKLLEVLRENEVECGMVEVPGEDHTFAMGMRVGSRTWELQRQGFDFLEEVISRS
ncbi:hypothetical protein FE257_011465 [Aspergillus nanangensis]|uniref:BD-FAE-like domain-containing protein n=1 Tax=Aspergillus nanangensis TaxID=2582783 RepID=A0AAD4CHN8_ASPNN|nr:hypothetical protein FE257_011465 [Aspergillus nanangensis]